MSVTISVEHLYLAIDQGGHATRALVYNAKGGIVAKAMVPMDTIYSSYDDVDTVELDPQQLISSLTQSLTQVADELGSRCRHIVAAGLVTQRSTIVCWDRNTGSALYPIISWQDTRAHQWLSQFEPSRERIRDITGLFLSPHYGVSKMRWCLDNVASVKDAQKRGRLIMGPLSSFLTYHILSQRPLLVDPANATRTLLWNKRTHDWDSELLKLFRLPSGVLPKCVSTRHDYGSLVVNGICIPLCIVTGDQSAVIFGYGTPGSNECFMNIGSGAFVLRHINEDTQVPNTLLTGVVYQDTQITINVVEGTVNGAGNALQWFKQRYNCNDLEAQLSAWVGRDCSKVMFINGIAGLGSPYWVPKLRSRFEGEGEIPDKAVALLDSIVFLLQTNLDVMEQSLPKADTIIVTGGLAQQDALCQRLADLSSRNVFRSDEKEATARGLAYLLADFPVGWSQREKDIEFTPQHNPVLRDRYQSWQRLMQNAIGSAS